MKIGLIMIGIPTIIAIILVMVLFLTEENEEDYLLNNEPKYLGQGRWIKE